MSVRMIVFVVAGLVLLASCGGVAINDEATEAAVGAPTTSITANDDPADRPQDGSPPTSSPGATREPGGSESEEDHVSSGSGGNDVEGEVESSSTSAPGSQSSLGETTNPSTAVESSPATIEQGLQPFVYEAVADLSARLGSGNGIAVVVAEMVVWPDASLGCPRPGMVYAQVTTDGARILLQAGGRRYHYHMGGSHRSPFSCETPSDI